MQENAIKQKNGKASKLQSCIFQPSAVHETGGLGPDSQSTLFRDLLAIFPRSSGSWFISCQRVRKMGHHRSAHRLHRQIAANFLSGCCLCCCRYCRLIPWLIWWAFLHQMPFLTQRGFEPGGECYFYLTFIWPGDKNLFLDGDLSQDAKNRQSGRLQGRC